MKIPKQTKMRAIIFLNSNMVSPRNIADKKAPKIGVRQL